MMIWLGLFVFFALLFVIVGMQLAEVRWGVWWVQVVDGWVRLFVRRYHRLHGDQIDLPQSGGVLLVSNHVSGLDPLLLISASKRPLRFLIAEEEYHRFGLRWIFKAAGCIPVDRGGRTDAAFRAAVRALKNGDVVALFPHGRIHPDHVEDARIKPGALRLATLAQVPIYTARISGVAGEGEVMASVFKRSHAHIQGLSVLPADQAHGVEMRQQLGELLLGRRSTLEITGH